jgi:Protein of unknown function (DUF3579)
MQQSAIPTARNHLPNLHPMVTPAPHQVFIQGVTRDGKTFRPSDWAERLAGVMSAFRPGGAQPGSHLSYSPWCIPRTVDNVKCVIVHRDLRDAEPMAWDFVMHFARDNDLRLVDGAVAPDRSR